MARPIKSKAKLNRIAKGIQEPPKNPKKVAVGEKTAINNLAREKELTPKQAESRYKQLKNLAIGRTISKHSKKELQVVKAVTAEMLQTNSVNTVKEQTKQQLIKSGVHELFLNVANDVAHRLIDLARGRNGFEDAPASVQRLAMIDVLTFAGISQQQAEKQAKPVHEMSAGELELLIAATEQHLHEVRTSQKTVTIDQSSESSVNLE